MTGEQDSETQKEQELQELLGTRFLNSLEHLNAVLFDADESQQYLTVNRKKIIMSNNDHSYIRNQSYEQICALYASREEQIPLLRKAVRIKYNSHEVYTSHKTRKAMWLLLSRATHRIQQNPGYFDSLRHAQYPEYFGKVIQGDVKRTLENKSAQTHQKLSNILKTLARRNPYVGYCQGMNFIVNFLLTSFLGGSGTIRGNSSQKLLHEYVGNCYRPQTDLEFPQAEAPLTKRKIRIAEYIDFDIRTGMVGLSGNDHSPLQRTPQARQVLVIVWDLLFAQGSVVLLKMVILLIDELSSIILSCADMNQFLIELQPFKKKIVFDENSFLQKLQYIFIDRGIVNFARRIYESLMLINNKESQKKKHQVKCNPRWPICHHQLQKNKIQQNDPQPWVFKQDGPPRIIENYLDLRSKKQKVHRQDSRQKHRRLVIGRMAHTCEPSQQTSPNSIELNDYDPQTNSYQPPDSIGHQFIESATFLKQTIIFHVPHKQ